MTNGEIKPSVSFLSGPEFNFKLPHGKGNIDNHVKSRLLYKVVVLTTQER